MRESNKLQGNGAWHNARTGKLTASRMNQAMAFLKNGKEAEGRKKLKIEILAERLTGNIIPKYINEAMQHGTDTEPLAKEAFEQATGLLIKDVGFIEHQGIDNFGASPDGFVSDGSLIEIKCPTTMTHLQYLLNNEVPEEYKAQMCVQSLCTGKKDIWFCSYDPRLPEKQRLFIMKYQPTQEELELIEQAAMDFLNEVDEMFLTLTHGE